MAQTVQLLLNMIKSSQKVEILTAVTAVARCAARQDTCPVNARTLSRPTPSQRDKLANLFREASDARPQKNTRQTFVTLRRYAAAVAVLVVANRIASATPAIGILVEMHHFRAKYEASSPKSRRFDGLANFAPALIEELGTSPTI